MKVRVSSRAEAGLRPLERARGRSRLLYWLAAAAAALALFSYGAITTDAFLTTQSLKATLAGVGVLGIVAVGMTCITLSGSLFCLTLGTTLTVSSMAFLSWLEWGVVPAILATMALGVVIGGAQGLLVGGFGANPIIVTIGFGALQLGVASRLTQESAVYPPEDSTHEWLSSTIGGLPLSVYVLGLLVVCIGTWLSRSKLGRATYLVGENQRAARAAGLPVARVIVVAFSIAGGCAAIGGVLLGASEGNATFASGGDRYTYDAIAAVLVGGTAVAGGRGTVQQSVLGALFIALISNMLLLRGYSGGIQMLFTGVVVVVVLVMFELKGRTE